MECSFNRTILELKFQLKDGREYEATGFQSYHTGIEMWHNIVAWGKIAELSIVPYWN